MLRTYECLFGFQGHLESAVFVSYQLLVCRWGKKEIGPIMTKGSNPWVGLSALWSSGTTNTNHWCWCFWKTFGVRRTVLQSNKLMHECNARLATASRPRKRSLVLRLRYKSTIPVDMLFCRGNHSTARHDVGRKKKNVLENGVFGFWIRPLVRRYLYEKKRLIESDSMMLLF